MTMMTGGGTEVHLLQACWGLGLEQDSNITALTLVVLLNDIKGSDLLVDTKPYLVYLDPIREQTKGMVFDTTSRAKQ